MAHRYILACSVFIFCRVNGDLLYGLKGLSVSLEPAIPSKPADILWKYNGNKLVEVNRNEHEHVYGTFKNRITLHRNTAKLEITDLRLEDSGNYDLEATINNELKKSSNRLVVIDKVSKPTISCQMNDGSSPNKSGTLECSAESKDSQTQSLTKFEWESRGNGPLLTISLGGEHDDHVYICKVSNPKSSETTAFTAKDCYPDESSSVALAAGLVTTLIIVVLGLAVAYICYRKRNRKEEKKNGQTKVQFVSESDQMTAQADEKEPLLDEPNTDQQPDTTKEVHNRTERQLFPHNPAANQSPGMTDVTTARGNGNSQDVDEAYQSVPVKERIKSIEEKKRGGKTNKRTAPPVAPRSALSPRPAKKEDPADEPADLGNKMPHQEPSPAPEESGSDQTTAQAEEKSTPTDGAATDQQPDRNKDGEMNNDKAPPVPPQPAEEEVPQANEQDQAGLENDKDEHERTGTPPTSPPYVNSVRRKFEQGSDQTTAQAEEKSTPTDGAATDQQPDRKKGYVNSVRRKFEKEEDGEANVPSDSVSPAKALSPLTQNSPNVTPENSAGEQSEDVDKPASTPGNELVNVDTPQQPHSPIPTKPDNEHTKTLQDSPDTPHETPDREKKTTQDSDESNEDEDETAQCGPKEEKPEQ